MLEQTGKIDLTPLNPEDCWEVPKVWAGVAPGAEVIDGKEWIPLNWVTGDLKRGGLADDLDLASRGMVVAPKIVEELAVCANLVSQERTVFGSGDLKSAASLVFKLINSERDAYLEEHYEKLSGFIDDNEGGLMQTFDKGYEIQPVAAYVCGIQLDSIEKKEDGNVRYDQWGVSLISRDSQGNIGCAPEGCQDRGLLVHVDLVKKLT